MVNAKFIGLHIHSFHQLEGFLDDGSSIAPGKDGSKKASYFNICWLGKKVRDGNGVIGNKKRLIVFINLFIKKNFQVLSIHA